MSDHDEVLERLDWIVAALKLILVEEVGVTPSDEDEVVDLPPQTHTPPVMVEMVVPQVCTHNQQAVVNGKLQCAKCGYVFGETGVNDPRAGVIHHVAGSGTREGQRG